jgi:hypothetical protein
MSTMTRRMSVMSGHESLDTGVTNRMSGCRTAFTKFDMGGGGSAPCISVMTQWHGLKAM